MKRGWIIVIGIVVLLGLILSIPATRESVHWGWASLIKSTAGYRSYVKTWSTGRHIDKAKERFDECGWKDAQKANTVAAFQEYLSEHPEGLHIAAAKVLMDEMSWISTQWAPTIASYQNYLMINPSGKYAELALANSEKLRTDPAPYNTAVAAGTEAALAIFLTAYPGHFKEAAVKQSLDEIRVGRDIVDLISEGKIEVKTQGSGIARVSLEIRRLSKYPLTVRIPVGSFFVSSSSSAQNMVSTAESSIRLDDNEWHFVSPDAACANRPRDIPGSEDSFSVQRSPHQAELAKLMPVLEKAGVDTATKQAAVWIVTDNADYDDLGTLVSSSGYIETRAINEVEIATAMKTCAEAGIDITRKAIWYDRQLIISGLNDGDLKTWLVNKK